MLSIEYILKDAFYELCKSPNKTVYTRQEIVEYGDKRLSRFTDNTKTVLLSKIMNILFTYNRKDKTYTKNEDNCTLLEMGLKDYTTNLKIVMDYLLLGIKMDFNHFYGKEALFLWVIQHFEYTFMTPIEFTDEFNVYCNNVSFSDLYDLIMKFQGSKIEYDTRAGLNQLLVYKNK